MKLPLLSICISCPSTLTSPTPALSDTRPLIVPWGPSEEEEVIVIRGTWVSEVILFVASACLALIAASSLRRRSASFSAAVSAAEVTAGLTSTFGTNAICVEPASSTT